MDFTRTQLALLSNHSREPIVVELARWADALLTRAENAEDRLHDAEEDFDTLNTEHTTLRSKLASAEAERDILQWASDHSGGKGEWTGDREWEGEPKGGLDKVRSEAENLIDTILPRALELCREIKSEANACAMRAATKNLEDELADLTEPEGAACDVGECSCNMGEPERPHEALVWAILYASSGCQDVEHADDLLEIWRYRWPEPKA